MDEYININDVKEKDLLFMPAKIKFNSLDEWRQFAAKYHDILRFWRDWYFNNKTLTLSQ